MFLMRVVLPDRPGSLGAVATAVGTAGADIRAIEIVDRGPDGAIDDFMLTLPDGAMPDNVVSVCQDIEGVRVLWLSRYPEGGGLEGDIELLERMTRQGEESANLLAEAGPAVFHCHWAVLVEHRSPPRPILATPMAPDLDPATLERFGPLDRASAGELDDGWLPSWGDITFALAPVRGGRTIILGRQGGPAFLPSEVARLRHLAGMAT